MRRREVAAAALLAGALALPRPARAAVPAPVAFRVLREGTPVGTHRVTFQEADGVLRARSEVSILVRLMGITVYRYSHETEEAWRGGRLIGLASRLDRNGTRRAVQARAEGGALLVATDGGAPQRLAAETVPLTWWRAESFPDAPLFDPRDGQAVRPRLERLGPPPGGGARWRLVGGEGAEIAYDAAGRWSGFATTGEDGSAIRYERG